MSELRAMKQALTIAMITARHEPRFDWFFQSLALQAVGHWDSIQLVVVDLYKDEHPDIVTHSGHTVLHVYPKPSVWQGNHRLTKENWWDIAGAKNTAACYCRTEWIGYVDDRAILSPTWLEAVNDAMHHRYAIAGAYEKRTGMEVTDGVITTPGEIIGVDSRKSRGMFPQAAPGEWFYGCTTALPLEWLLEVNGFDESCNGLGLEDSIMGRMLVENRHPIKYDPRMKLIEDRTQSACTPTIRRTDKGKSPNDKSHAVLARTKGKKRATHHWDIRAIRESVQRGEPFPAATEPKTDWWDGEPLSEIYVR